MNAKEFIFREGTLSDQELEAIAEALYRKMQHRSPFQIPTQSEQKEPPIKTQDVCRLLQVSDTTVRTWIREGKIPCHRKGSRVYFFRSEVMASLEQPLKRA